MSSAFFFFSIHTISEGVSVAKHTPTHSHDMTVKYLMIPLHLVRATSKGLPLRFHPAFHPSAHKTWTFRFPGARQSAPIYRKAWGFYLKRSAETGLALRREACLPRESRAHRSEFLFFREFVVLGEEGLEGLEERGWTWTRQLPGGSHQEVS